MLSLFLTRNSSVGGWQVRRSQTSALLSCPWVPLHHGFDQRLFDLIYRLASSTDFAGEATPSHINGESGNLRSQTSMMPSCPHAVPLEVCGGDPGRIQKQRENMHDDQHSVLFAVIKVCITSTQRPGRQCYLAQTDECNIGCHYVLFGTNAFRIRGE